jgi:hypothetical protein
LLIGKPSSAMRTINRISAHSPRSFLPITFGIRFFITHLRTKKAAFVEKRANAASSIY